MNKDILSREEWIDAAVKFLTEYFHHAPNHVHQYAEGLAQSYYDEGPGDYTPEQAVREDASYA